MKWINVNVRRFKFENEKRQTELNMCSTVRFMHFSNSFFVLSSVAYALMLHPYGNKHIFISEIAYDNNNNNEHDERVKVFTK